MREQTGRYLPLPWMRYPVQFQDEAARQAIEGVKESENHFVIPDCDDPDGLSFYTFDRFWPHTNLLRGSSLR